MKRLVSTLKVFFSDRPWPLIVQFAMALITILLFCSAPMFANGTKDSVEGEPSSEEQNSDEIEKIDFSYCHDIPDGGPIEVKETWAYVLNDRAYEYKSAMPVTDLVIFSADVNCYGEFDSIPSKKKFSSFKGRTHLSVTCQSYSLSHMVLEPQFGLTKKMIETLVRASNDFDGINIDFELIPKRDYDNFQNFIKNLRKSLGVEKWLTVAVPARVKTLSSDAFDYKTLEPYVDRIFIMAYDEHWSTSAPGAIASTAWCERIADYALSVLPQKKIVMGLPFYGRTWQSESYGKAWYFSGINRILDENEIRSLKRERGVPYFSMKKEVDVTGYFEDAYSIVEKCKVYTSKGIERIGFWRIGQEDPDFWDYIKIK